MKRIVVEAKAWNKKLAHLQTFGACEALHRHCKDVDLSRRKLLERHVGEAIYRALVCFEVVVELCNVAESGSFVVGEEDR